jgi:hypothetical protein
MPRHHIADENFAFPKERKEPIHDAAHVRNAIARFKQVQGVTEAERDAAWNRVKIRRDKTQGRVERKRLARTELTTRMRVPSGRAANSSAPYIGCSPEGA